MNDRPCNRLAALLAALALLAASARGADAPRFNRDVRPILAENCFACHGPDRNARKAGLRLDVREDALKADVFVPGKPDQSALIERIFSDEPSQLMPPPKSHKKLTAAQKDMLKRWVAAGAEYQPHWSFIAPTRSPLPAVKDARWVRNPIDRFILAGLEKRGLKPAPEADRRTLARRLSLDLTGLPPAPAEVEAFVNDRRPDAYERYVDKLLESPHWGEHRGRYWLDAARYADTHGIHFDNFREMWSYRDWVIRALNDNMPFDRFTVEQLAGDLLPNRTMDQQIASGFNRCNITSNEGGLIPEEYLVLYARDRTETTAQVWLGLTAGCCVCHDHKFDPLTQKEFYSLAAFFNNTTQGAMDGNIKDTPPTVLVPRVGDRPRWEALSKQLDQTRKQADARKQAARADFDKWLGSAKAAAFAGQPPSDALRFHAPLSEGEGKAIQVKVNGQPRTVAAAAGAAWGAGHVAARAFKIQPGTALEFGDAGDFEKDKPFSYGAWVKVTKKTLNGALCARMDDQHAFRGWDLWVQNGRVGAHIINQWPQDALKVVSKRPLKAGQWSHVFVAYDGSGKAAGVKVYVNGVAQPTDVEADRLKSTIRTKVPMKLAQRHSTSRMDGVLMQDLRLYGRLLSGLEVEKLARGTRAAWLIGKAADKRTAAEKSELFDWWLPSLDPVFADRAKRLDGLRQEETVIRARGTVAHVMQERPQEAMAYVLFRGDYDKRRDPVKPATPKVLPPLPPGLPHNRLGLARWLVRTEHPLTARVTVNRFWQEVFGTGIVRTSGDFGLTGEAPSNQELLDWLAVDFRESGWDVKRFFKQLVTSAAYRQSAAATPEKLAKDPDNRLLSHGPRFRMDAEMVRDYALAASGLLVRKLGGPSVKPYQPDGVWEAVAMIGSNTRDYRRDSGEGLYRRSMYTFWKRAAPPASMDILNAPNRETCTVRRERTNTPLQALVTLNDPQFVEAARVLAQRVLKEGGDKDIGRLDALAKRLLARPLRPEEAKVVGGVLADLLAHYKAHPADVKKLLTVGESKADVSLDASTLAAWTMLANQMMNLDEVLNK
jgi:hypothetical protein